MCPAGCRCLLCILLTPPHSHAALQPLLKFQLFLIDTSLGVITGRVAVGCTCYITALVLSVPLFLCCVVRTVLYHVKNSPLPRPMTCICTHAASAADCPRFQQELKNCLHLEVGKYKLFRI